MSRTRLTIPSLLVGLGFAVLGGWLVRRWTIPVRERAINVPVVPDAPLSVPAEEGIQSATAGSGPRFHRRYRVDIGGAEKNPEALIQCIEADIQAFVPPEIALFEKRTGAPDRFAVGDEIDIAIRSPWNGPVRIVEKTPTSFTFATLDGHLEAGQIRFAAEPLVDPDGALRFSIESWARSRDGVVDFVYDTLGLGKEMQKQMWTFFCDRVVTACEGTQLGPVTVTTEREVTDE